MDKATRGADQQPPSHHCLPGPVLSVCCSTGPSQQRCEGATPILQARRLSLRGWKAADPHRSLVLLAPRPVLFTAPAAFLHGTGERPCRELDRWQLLCKGDFTALGCLEKINTVSSICLATGSRETAGRCSGPPAVLDTGTVCFFPASLAGSGPAWPALRLCSCHS